MNALLLYFLKVNIAIALFYLFYRLVFYNDTFWATRRYYLVFSILLSVVYPFISLSGWLEKQEPMQVILANYVQLNEITVTATRSKLLTFENILPSIYGIVCAILLIKMVVQLASILRWKLKGQRQVLNGLEIIAIDGDITPFSFFRSIFLNPSLHNEQELLHILTHENTHARQLHSLDVLLGELLTIFFWVNPAAWLLKREIRNNLEYLADNSVLQSGIDSRNYQYHLLQLSYRIPEINLINKFNVSPLKKRITMMNQQKSAKAGILKYSLIVPLALALVLSSNVQTLVASAKKALTSTKNTEVTVNSTVNNAALASSESQASKPILQKQGTYGIYTTVTKVPLYPGGDKAMMEYLAKNIRYPAEAQKNNEQGVVYVRFIVSATGKVEKPEILKSISPSLDQEALRIVNNLPDWTPGEMKGKKVSVYYTLPIAYKLDDGTKTKSESVKNFITVTAYKDLDKPKTAIDPKNPPVYVIDGVQQPRGIKDIKPETIASMNVLKPETEKRKAELIAQYGEDAANGVILITTKK